MNIHSGPAQYETCLNHLKYTYNIIVYIWTLKNIAIKTKCNYVRSQFTRKLSSRSCWHVCFLWKLKIYFLKETKLEMLTRLPPRSYKSLFGVWSSCNTKHLLWKDEKKNTIGAQVIKQNKVNKTEYCFTHPKCKSLWERIHT